MEFRRRDVVNTLWALGLPFLIDVICTAVITALASYTSLIDFNSVPLGTTPPGVTVVRVAWMAALALGSAVGYVFVWRLFVRRAIAIAVAVIYFPLMYYAGGWFSADVVMVVFRDGP
jgi:hypothetical protein